ncbi:MAG: hypothetical protein ABUL42_02835 [Terricaulis silvestris]
MSRQDETTDWHAQEHPEEPGPRVVYAQAPSTTLLSQFMRTMATFWVMILMLAAAGLAVGAFIKLQDSERQLADEQQKTRPEAWALVDYRNELQTTVQSMREDPFMDAPPLPPSRPPLQVEIDNLRVQNSALREEINARLRRSNEPRPRRGGWPE